MLHVLDRSKTPPPHPKKDPIHWNSLSPKMVMAIIHYAELKPNSFLTALYHYFLPHGERKQPMAMVITESHYEKLQHFLHFPFN